MYVKDHAPWSWEIVRDAGAVFVKRAIRIAKRNIIKVHPVVVIVTTTLHAIVYVGLLRKGETMNRMERALVRYERKDIFGCANLCRFTNCEACVCPVCIKSESYCKRIQVGTIAICCVECPSFYTCEVICIKIKEALSDR